MQVICINAFGDWSNQLKEGGNYTVIGNDCDEGYILREIKHPMSSLEYGFKKHRFIPLSSIDETEMVREYQTEKV